MVVGTTVVVVFGTGVLVVVFGTEVLVVIISIGVVVGIGVLVTMTSVHSCMDFAAAAAVIEPAGHDWHEVAPVANSQRTSCTWSFSLPLEIPA